jgi:hypothetical protein
MFLNSVKILGENSKYCYYIPTGSTVHNHPTSILKSVSRKNGPDVNKEEGAPTIRLERDRCTYINLVRIHSQWYHYLIIILCCKLIRGLYRQLHYVCYNFMTLLIPPMN